MIAWPLLTLSISRSNFPYLIQKWPELRPVWSGIERIGATTPRHSGPYGEGRGIKSGASRRKRGNLDERDQLIRLDLEQGMRQQEIALKYGLTQARVSQIISELHRWSPEIRGEVSKFLTQVFH